MQNINNKKIKESISKLVHKSEPKERTRESARNDVLFSNELCVCVRACVRVCGGGKKEGGARILNTARQTNFKIFKKEAFFLK